MMQKPGRIIRIERGMCHEASCIIQKPGGMMHPGVPDIREAGEMSHPEVRMMQTLGWKAGTAG